MGVLAEVGARGLGKQREGLNNFLLLFLIAAFKKRCLIMRYNHLEEKMRGAYKYAKISLHVSMVQRRRGKNWCSSPVCSRCQLRKRRDF